MCNLHKADWNTFQSLCRDRFLQVTVKDEQGHIEILTTILHGLATENILKTLHLYVSA